MESEYLKEFIKKNIMFGSEVSELLGVTKQQVNRLARSGKIDIVKEGPNAFLFMREDVLAYMEEKRKNNLEKKITVIETGNTRNAITYFEQMPDYDKIRSVDIYFDRADAILDGHYKSRERVQSNTLVRIVAPTCVITYENDEEYWFDGLNCGYGGEGPRGSREVLKQLGVPEEKLDLLLFSKWVKCYRETDGWDVINKRRVYNTEDDDLGVSMCMFNDNLVLVQKKMSKYQMDTNPAAFLEKYCYFIPQPVSVTFMSREEARRTGHYSDFSLHAAVYQVIIKDISGRELWLDIPVATDRPISKQQDLQNLLAEMGMGFSPESSEKFSEKILSWLRVEPRVIDKLTYSKH